MRNSQSKLVIDINAIEKNYSLIQKLQPDKKILPVLKAGGYGIGLDAIGVLIKNLNLDMVGVAIVDEGVALREKLNYKGEIVVLNQPSMDDIENIVNFNITTSCCYIEFLQEINRIAKKLQKIAKVHLEIETGMGRTGVQLENLENFIKQAVMLKNICIEGIFTHFATSDTDLEYTKYQIENFEEAIKYIQSKISTIKYVHCGNSSGIINLKNLPGNMVRPGIMLYGYLPDDSLKGKIELTPSCTLKSKISFIKDVEANTSISYGRTFITKRKSKIANVPIGYADGIRRALSNNGYVIIHNQKAPIVGRICMDSFMIDVTEIENVNIGDEVYIWNNEKITLEEVAARCCTINYEILSTISNRVVRELK